jgi:D-alanine-D-alanine ligase-like ATP-grasp enzyme
MLRQAASAPPFAGLFKPMKPGGYRDSCADVAFALRAAGVDVATPVPQPSAARDVDWSFPDSDAGVAAAVEGAGASVLWANTQVHASHPVWTSAAARAVALVAPNPALVDFLDVKSAANDVARLYGVPTADAALVGDWPGALPLADATAAALAARGLTFPLVAKPLRGRGSEGVSVVSSEAQLRAHLEGLRAATFLDDDGVPRPLFGPVAMVEAFLPGQEITVAVMPPGRYALQGQLASRPTCWALPPVLRRGHHDGVAPYSGVVAVTHNSSVATPAEAADPAMVAAVRACESIGLAFAIRAPMRVDCRADARGIFRVFDINAKPNMTGPGRPGRDGQDSLVALAARAVGWTFADLVVNILAQAQPGAR